MQTHDKGRLIVISGPSGTGKGTVIGKLRELRGDVCLSVSVTTRAPRPGEVDGRDYFFVTREEFSQKVAEGALLEHAEFVGNCYGTPREYVERKLDQGVSVILEIDVQGAEQVAGAARTPFPSSSCRLPARSWSGGCAAGTRTARRRYAPVCWRPSASAPRPGNTDTSSSTTARTPPRARSTPLSPPRNADRH